VTSRAALALAGVLLALAVVMGALGVHVFHGRFSADSYLVYQVAERFHFYQALGLLGAGLLLRSADSRVLRLAAALIAAGTLLFCGGIYALALGASPVLGRLPPVGGPLMIAGWLVFAWGAWRSPAGSLGR
jgi:uncharacterized membrane protein YgdD (TMEM256/DUF423 family)